MLLSALHLTGVMPQTSYAAGQKADALKCMCSAPSSAGMVQRSVSMLMVHLMCRGMACFRQPVRILSALHMPANASAYLLRCSVLIISWQSCVGTHQT